MVNSRYVDLFKSHHSPKVRPQSLTSLGKKLKNRVVNAVAALPLLRKDGAAISRTGNNNGLNNRRGEEKYEMIRAICPINRAFDSHFTKEFNEFRSI
jgi:hypothetical protein